MSANGAGLVTSFANSSLHLTNQASVACAEAVGNAVKGLCEGGDPLATITAVSSTCASALVQMTASSISGIDITPSTDVALVSPSKKSFTLACSNGCMNAETSAESVAQSTGCAWLAASKGCNAVRVALTSQNYAQAFIKTTAASWSNACALGRGKAVSRGTAQAKSTAEVLARAFGEVVAAACSNCDTCKCKPLPPGWTYDKMKDLSDAVATTVQGKFTMSKAISRAVGSYCDSDKSTKALQAGVDVTLSTMAVIIANVSLQTGADAMAQGAAMSCAGGFVSQQIKVSDEGMFPLASKVGCIVIEEPGVLPRRAQVASAAVVRFAGRDTEKQLHGLGICDLMLWRGWAFGWLVAAPIPAEHCVGKAWRHINKQQDHVLALPAVSSRHCTSAAPAAKAHHVLVAAAAALLRKRNRRPRWPSSLPLQMPALRYSTTSAPQHTAA